MDASGHYCWQCSPAADTAADGAAAAASVVVGVLAEAAALEGSAAVVASAVVAVGPVGEIQAREATDLPFVPRGVRSR